MKNKKISVIVPIYNMELYLEQSLNSIIKNDYLDLEIILINDGSTDSSYEICLKYKEIDNRIQIINKKNGGVSSARNAGLDIATGEYISFIDPDDFIENNFFSFHMKNMQENNADISICGRYIYYDDKKSSRFPTNAMFLSLSSEEAINCMNLRCFGYFDSAPWDKIYQRELFNEIRFPLNKLSEDWFIMHELFELANKIVFNSTPLYYYRQRQGSLTRNRKVNFDAIEASDNVLMFVKEKYPHSIDQALISCLYALLGVYNHIFLRKEYKKETKEIIIKFKKYYKQIRNKKYMFGIRKHQIKLFIYFRFLYNLYIKIFVL